MIDSEILDLIERFQTLLVGIVGFAGVIWTLRTNAKHSKEEYRRQTNTRRMTLRRILAAEFRNYTRALKANLEANEVKDDHLSVGKIDRLFSEDLASELGLLELGEVDVVLNALISLEGMDQFLGHISAGQRGKRYLIPASSMDDFHTITSTTADALDYAIEALELSGET
ncbi:hypothetical protein [uncultured Sulfitobacter sp.]|uniref:hypothetical protein n=1 Tax=uncultured Sulfitobacter sp. TaxID=191468 RepID=UPI0026304BDE|nr:hypothetical protein [uncultured Sulfitobacter sp.]